MRNARSFCNAGEANRNAMQSCVTAARTISLSALNRSSTNSSAMPLRETARMTNFLLARNSGEAFCITNASLTISERSFSMSELVSVEAHTVPIAARTVSLLAWNSWEAASAEFIKSSSNSTTDEANCNAQLLDVTAASTTSLSACSCGEANLRAQPSIDTAASTTSLSFLNASEAFCKDQLSKDTAFRTICFSPWSRGEANSNAMPLDFTAARTISLLFFKLG
mmetsp:Transcript_7280/g.17756  ORF Transcript_7280/g.17756 Transcript_7280/m.17756 type:complete len:224 (+) Transcript_7280:1299-1970(+)